MSRPLMEALARMFTLSIVVIAMSLRFSRFGAVVGMGVVPGCGVGVAFMASYSALLRMRTKPP